MINAQGGAVGGGTRGGVTVTAAHRERQAGKVHHRKVHVVLYHMY